MFTAILSFVAPGLISGQFLLGLLIEIIIVGLIFYLLWWLISYVGLPAPFDKVAKVILAVIAVLFLINVLLSLAGAPLFRW